MKRVLITGGTGFVGANLALKLLRIGHRVTLLVRARHLTWRLKEFKKDVEFRTAELSDTRSTERAVKQARPDWIFHLAAHGAYSYQSEDKAIVSANLLGTINLLGACAKKGFDAFVHAGSSSEYGYKDHAPREDEPLEPNSLYAVTKAAATHYCRFFALKHGFKVPTLRLYSAYGPYEEPTRLMPVLIVKGLGGRLPPLVSPGTVRDFIYIDDIIDAFLKAARSPLKDPGAVFNLGTGHQIRMRDVVSVARRVLRIEDKPRWGSMARRKWDTNVWVANSAKIRRQLKWSPKQTFEKGFAKTVAWFQSNPKLLRYYRQRIL